VASLREGIEINLQFAEALRLMEETGNNIFITGRAGTGKSTLLEYFRSITRKKIVVLAPTGVAAVNISGQTIHSFFGFRPDVTVDKVKKGAKKKASPIYKNIDSIVIDEISMVRSDLLDCVDQFLRINGKTPGAPCGGIQMILIGDLYQIPPVVTGQERQIFKEYYESEYFFDAKVFQDMEFTFLELEKIYRQTDPVFIELLNKIRNKTVTGTDLETINRRAAGDNLELPDGVIYLTTTNAMADKRNEAELEKLPGKRHYFTAEIGGEVDKKYFPAAEVLQLKEGAQVMLLNNDAEGRWINGTIGTIAKIKKDELSVRLLDGATETVKPFKWSINRFFWDQDTKSVASETMGTFKQYPLKLAWAITIHKSQGKTFDHVAIDLGRGAFVPGQLYVALSRCRNLEGIYLKKKIRETDIWIDWRVVKFITGFQYQLSEKNMPVDKKVLLIKQAIENKSSLEITYLKSEDEKTQRMVSPRFVGDMEYRGKPFLGMEAYCHNRKALRNFRVDRILEIHAVVSP
jgi:ATP-dependent DNA helicase PIF1